MKFGGKIGLGGGFGYILGYKLAGIDIASGLAVGFGSPEVVSFGLNYDWVPCLYPFMGTCFHYIYTWGALHLNRFLSTYVGFAGWYPSTIEGTYSIHLGAAFNIK